MTVAIIQLFIEQYIPAILVCSDMLHWCVSSVGMEVTKKQMLSVEQQVMTYLNCCTTLQSVFV